MSADPEKDADGTVATGTQQADPAPSLETATVKLPADALEFLRTQAAARGITMGEMLRIALGTHKFLKEKVDGGAKVQVLENNRTLNVAI